VCSSFVLRVMALNVVCADAMLARFARVDTEQTRQ
jgi:hypothetical protein